MKVEMLCCGWMTAAAGLWRRDEGEPEKPVRSAERLRGLREEGFKVQPGHDPEVLRPGPVTA